MTVRLIRTTKQFKLVNCEDCWRMFLKRPKYPSVAVTLLDTFRDEMLSKLELRAAKHPNDNFLALSVEQLMNYSLQPIIDHANQEIEELYTARAFEGPVATMKENVDNANMNFIEWAILKMKEPIT